MAYQTGTVVSAADLAATIKSFAAANGWTLAGDVLSKGGAYVRITAPDATEVRIEGARNGNFSAPDICPRYSMIYNTAWPSVATYHLIAFANPDTVWCTINFAVTDHQHLGFGMLQKYGSWVGGAWFHAQHCGGNPYSKNLNVHSTVDGGTVSVFNTDGKECALFWSQRDGQYVGKASMLHCELRGYVWDSSGGIDSSDLQTIHCPTVLRPTHKCNPNAFNGQTVLSPFQLFLLNTDGHYMPIGHVDHVRWLKLSNYNPGDVLAIGPDRWKVYPWSRKDGALPDGSRYPSLSTGVLGVAVRYDGA